MAYHNEDVLLSLLIITVLAAAVPIMTIRFRRLQIPVVVGEILVGIAIGKSGLNIIAPNPILEFLAWFGFIFLMFISGLEIDFDVFTLPNQDQAPWYKRPLPLAGLVFALTLLLGISLGITLQQIGIVQDAILMGLILSTTSLGVVVPVLKQHSIIASSYGQIVLISALLADFVTLLFFSLDVALLSTGLTLDLLLVLFILVIFAVAMRASRRLSQISMVQRLMHDIARATTHIEVRGAFALMMAWAALAIGLGVEVILGAFLAGALVSLLTERHESALRDKLDAFGFGFFIPIFFIMVGVNFDLQAFLSSRENVLLVPLLLIAAFAIKLLSTLPFRLLFSWRETFSAGMLLSARLSLIIAASAIALDLHAIDEAVNAAIILTALITVTVSPILFERILQPKPPASRRPHYVIVSSREMGLALAQRLRSSGSVTIIARKTLRQQAKDGIQVLQGDARNPDILRAAGIEHASGVVVLGNETAFNEQICRLARERFAAENIVTWQPNAMELNESGYYGARVIQPGMATLLALEGSLLFPDAYDLMAHRTPDMELREVQLRNRRFHQHSLREIRLPGDVLVIGLRRQGERIVPHGDTMLHNNDMLLLVGSPAALADATLWLEGSSPA